VSYRDLPQLNRRNCRGGNALGNLARRRAGRGRSGGRSPNCGNGRDQAGKTSRRDTSNSLRRARRGQNSHGRYDLTIHTPAAYLRNRSQGGVWSIFRLNRSAIPRRAGRKHGPDPLESPPTFSQGVNGYRICPHSKGQVHVFGPRVVAGWGYQPKNVQDPGLGTVPVRQGRPTNVNFGHDRTLDNFVVHPPRPRHLLRAGGTPAPQCAAPVVPPAHRPLANALGRAGAQRLKNRLTPTGER
jgi:hypothetical protein